MTTESIPPRWRSTRADAAAVRECARSHGVSDRSVRAWRRTNDPRWLKFLSARAGQNLGQLEAIALRTDLENSTPEEEEKSALRRFKLLEREITAAMDRGELSSIPTITRAAADSHKLLCACREATEGWKLRQKELVTAAEVRQYREIYVEAMVVAIKNLPLEVADQANPSDPETARAAMQWWLENRFQKHYFAAREAIQTLQPQPASPPTHHEHADI